MDATIYLLDVNIKKIHIPNIGRVCDNDNSTVIYDKHGEIRAIVPKSILVTVD